MVIVQVADVKQRFLLMQLNCCNLGNIIDDRHRNEHLDLIDLVQSMIEDVVLMQHRSTKLDNCRRCHMVDRWRTECGNTIQRVGEEEDKWLWHGSYYAKPINDQHVHIKLLSYIYTVQNRPPWLCVKTDTLFSRNIQYHKENVQPPTRLTSFVDAIVSLNHPAKF